MEFAPVPLGMPWSCGALRFHTQAHNFDVLSRDLSLGKKLRPASFIVSSKEIKECEQLAEMEH